MNSKKMTTDEIIEYLKEKGFPASLLDKEAMKSNRKLAPEEQEIFIKHIVDNLRTIEANKYLTSCLVRFGPGITSTYAFRHENNVIAIDEEIIETLLIHQIENMILEKRPNDGYSAIWKFYISNDQHEKDTGEKWMQNFIDEVFIKGTQFLSATVSNNLIH
ncbi:hypothetical protein [Proteus penneri]|uniref:hypothetical protein n=1 Tax=Proteus penneri TaxID=102862 RepID=UPI000DFE6A22|nr:hypothetical protein [Proteus penneri]SUC02464.1 Uncharacterised protein [Proteus penneri]